MSHVSLGGYPGVSLQKHDKHLAIMVNHSPSYALALLLPRLNEAAEGQCFTFNTGTGLVRHIGQLYERCVDVNFACTVILPSANFCGQVHGPTKPEV